MFTFLRKLRKSLIETGSARKPVLSVVERYLLYAIGEIALVVIGILIALQINNLNVERKEVELERQYLKSLLSDLAKDKIDLISSVEFGSIPIVYNDSLFLELQKRPLQGNEKRIYHFLLLYTNGIQLSYYDRTISQLRNSGGFGLIRNQKVSDAILDYDVHMRGSMDFEEINLSNLNVVNDIMLNHKIYELYRVEHLKDSAIVHKEEMTRVPYPDDLRLLSYNDFDIKLVLNAMASVRKVDENKYQRAVKALELNRKLDSLIRGAYQL